MLHRHMALDRIAADHGRVARRQLVGHAISRLYGSHVSAVLDGHRIALSAGNIGPGFAATALGVPIDEDGHTHLPFNWRTGARSEEHTSELQSLMRISYAVFCLQKKKQTYNSHSHDQSPTPTTSPH